MRKIAGRNVGLVGIGVLCLALMSGAGCASSSGKTTVSQRNHWAEMDRIFVLPFQNMTEIYGEGEHLKSPLGDQFYMAGKIEPDADRHLTRRLKTILEKRPDLHFIFPDEPEDVGSVAIYENTAPDKRQLTEMGNRQGADGILVGYLYRFRDRVGNTMAVSEPSSVIFELFLMDVKTGSVVWSGYFNETQKSLSEDLLQIRKVFQRGGKWVTAENMADAALAEMIDEIPGE